MSARLPVAPEIAAKMVEITERTEDGGWLVRTTQGPIMFPPDCGALAAATAQIEAETVKRFTVELLRRTVTRRSTGTEAITFDVEINGHLCGRMLPDSVRRDWLFAPTTEGRKRHGDHLFFRRFAMDLHSLPGKRQAVGAIHRMLQASS